MSVRIVGPVVGTLKRPIRPSEDLTVTRERRALRTSMASVGAVMAAVMALVVSAATPGAAEVAEGTGPGHALAVGTFDSREVVALDTSGRVVASGDTTVSVGWIAACHESAWINGSPSFVLVSTDGQRAILWDSVDMEAETEWSTGVAAGSTINDVTCLPGYAAVETSDALVLSNPVGVVPISTAGANDVAVSNGTTPMAFVLEGSSMRLIELDSGVATTAGSISLPRAGGAIAVSPDGRRVAIASESPVAGETDRRVMTFGLVTSGWTLVSDAEIPSIPAGPESISWLDNYYFAVREASNGTAAGRVSVYGLAGEKKSRTPVSLVRSTISTSGNQVIALSAEGNAHLIEVGVDSSRVMTYTMPGTTRDVAASLAPINFSSTARRSLVTTTTTTARPATTTTTAAQAATTTTTVRGATTTTTEPEGGDLGKLGPGVAIDSPDGLLVIANATNQTLSFNYSGPESGSFTVPGTGAVSVDDCGTEGVETRQVSLEPGRYRVTAQVPSSRTLSSSWQVNSGNEYYHCFYIIGANTRRTTTTRPSTTTTTIRRTTTTTPRATTTTTPRAATTTTPRITTTTARATTTTVFSGSPEDFQGGNGGGPAAGPRQNGPQSSTTSVPKTSQGAPLPWLTTTVPGDLSPTTIGPAGDDAEAGDENAEQGDAAPGSLPFQRPNGGSTTGVADDDGSTEESALDQATGAIDGATSKGLLRTLLEWAIVAAIVLALSAGVVMLIRSIVSRTGGGGGSKRSKKSDDSTPGPVTA